METNENNQPPAVDSMYQHPLMHTNETVNHGEASTAFAATAENTVPEDETIGNYLTQLQAAKKEKAQKDMLFGGLWCVGGIVATVADIGYIFWGAIVFGGIQFFRGLANLKSED